MTSLSNAITKLKYNLNILFADSFKDEEDETLYGWYDAVLEGK